MDKIKERICHYWAERSDSFLDQKRHEWHSYMAKRWYDVLEPHLFLDNKEGLKALDVGCGTGFFSILLARNGYHVSGIDITKEMIERAKLFAEQENFVADFRVMDAEKLDFADNTFDVILTRNVTWTLPHPYEAYKEWLRVLKPGGLLVNVDSNYGKNKMNDRSVLPKNHGHNQLSDNMLNESEAIQRLLELSHFERPEWDATALLRLGITQLTIDTNISDALYIEKDEFYNPVPPFLIVVKK